MERAPSIKHCESALDVTQVAQAIEQVKLGEEAEVALSVGVGSVGGDATPLPVFPPDLARQRRKSATSTSIELLRRNGAVKINNMKTTKSAYTGQVHEDDPAEVIIVCEPDLNNNVMGSIHPHGALYERPVNVNDSRKQHEEFRRILRDHGVHCLTVHQILTHETEKNLRARMELERLAASRLQYKLHPDTAMDDLKPEDVYYLGELYKEQVLTAMSTEHLIDMIMTVPTVWLKPSMRDTGFTATYSFEPMTNMQYTRDQQITTAKGIVMGRLRSLQRQKEVELMDFCFEKLGLAICGQVEEPGFLEGGDFFVAGWDLCFLGVGLRTNLEAAEQLMQKDLFGTRRVAVVHDDFEQDQARMHLDCIFNILGRDCVVLVEDAIGEESPVKRTVTEYVRGNQDEKNERTGRYKVLRQGVEFSAYLQENGYNIIPISREDQLAYGCNSINLGNGTIVASNREASRKIINSGLFHGSIEIVDFGSITSMYGGLHCSTQEGVQWKSVPNKRRSDHAFV